MSYVISDSYGRRATIEDALKAFKVSDVAMDTLADLHPEQAEGIQIMKQHLATVAGFLQTLTSDVRCELRSPDGKQVLFREED